MIFGARTIEQLDENLRAAELSLSDAQVQAISDARKFEPGYPYDFMAGIAGRW